MVNKEILERIEDIYNTFGFEMYGESEKHRCDSNFIIDNFEEIKNTINDDEEHSKMLNNIVKRIRLHSLDILGYHTIVYEECHNMNLYEFIEYAENYNRNEEKYKNLIDNHILNRINNLSRII